MHPSRAVIVACLLSAGRAAIAQRNDTDLAKASQNPVANMASLPLQYNYYTEGGLGSRTQLVLNVQPVLPLVLNKDWLVISRTIVPFVNLPLPGDLRAKGIADIQQQFYFTPKKSGKVTWGAGPIASFPTSTNDFIRTGQWALGPTAVVLVSPGRWLIGTLANNLWRVSGIDHTRDINALTVQPFVNFNIPPGWAIITAPIITSDWSAPQGQRWTVPVGIGLSKITRVARQPISLAGQYYHAVKHPDAAGGNQLRLQVNLLFPEERR